MKDKQMVPTFEAKGLGVAPFTFVGFEEKVFSIPGEYSKAGGTCQLCGTPIRFCYWFQDATGKRFYVGSTCVGKHEKLTNVSAYAKAKREHDRKVREEKRMQEFRAEEAKWEAAKAEYESIMNSDWAKSVAHPKGLTDWKTGKVRSYADYMQFIANCNIGTRIAVLNQARALMGAACQH